MSDPPQQNRTTVTTYEVLEKLIDRNLAALKDHDKAAAEGYEDIRRRLQNNNKQLQYLTKVIIDLTHRVRDAVQPKQKDPIV